MLLNWITPVTGLELSSCDIYLRQSKGNEIAAVRGGGKAMGERRFILPAVLANRHNPFGFSSEFKGNSYAQP